MECQNSIKKNMIMSAILTASNFLFPLITYSYVARVLLPEGTGKVAFVQAVLAYFSYIAALGISSYGTRECAKVRDNKNRLSILVQELLRINICSTVVAYVLLIVALILVPKFHEYAILFVVMSSGILLQTLGMEWLYNALEKYSYITIRSIIFKTISVALTFLLVKKPDDYIVYGAITIFATSASNLLNFINSRKYISIHKLSSYNLKRHIKPICVFFFSTIIVSVYGHFDSMMLGFMKGDYEVGIYNAAAKIKGIVLSVSTAVTSVLIPRMSVYYTQKDEKAIYDLISKSIRIVLVLLLPLSVFIILNAIDVLNFVCGEEFVAASRTLCVLMLCAIVLSFTNIFGNQILIPRGNEKRYSSSVFIGMFINMLCNFILIPNFLSLGAAIATLGTETFNAVWMGSGCIKEMKEAKKRIAVTRYLVPFFIALFVEIIILYFTKLIPLVLRLTVNSIVFFGVYWIFLIINKEPIFNSIIKTISAKIRQ